MLTFRSSLSLNILFICSLFFILSTSSLTFMLIGFNILPSNRPKMQQLQLSQITSMGGFLVGEEWGTPPRNTRHEKDRWSGPEIVDWTRWTDWSALDLCEICRTENRIEWQVLVVLTINITTLMYLQSRQNSNLLTLINCYLLTK